MVGRKSGKMNPFIRDAYERSEEIMRLSDNLLTVKETANLLGMPIQTIYTWIHNGKIPAEKIGNSYIITKQDLVDLNLIKGYIDEEGELFVL